MKVEPYTPEELAACAEREARATPGMADRGRCYVCDRASCKVRTAASARDVAWGAFDAAKTGSGYSSTMRDAALQSSASMSAAERDCEAHRIDWRARAFDVMDETAAATARLLIIVAARDAELATILLVVGEPPFCEMPSLTKQRTCLDVEHMPGVMLCRSCKLRKIAALTGYLAKTGGAK